MYKIFCNIIKDKSVRYTTAKYTNWIGMRNTHEVQNNNVANLCKIQNTWLVPPCEIRKKNHLYDNK